MYHDLTYRRFSLPSPDVTCETEVITCEIRLSRVLPDAVREWFMRGDARSLPGLDALFPLEKITISETEKDASAIFMIYQIGDSISEYRFQFDTEDPWVEGQIDSKGWYRIATFTEFIVTRIWQSQPAKFSVWGWVDNLQIDRMQLLFPSDMPVTTDPIEWPLNPNNYHLEGQNVRIFISSHPGLILISIYAQTAEALAETLQIIAGLCDSCEDLEADNEASESILKSIIRKISET